MTDDRAEGIAAIRGICNGVMGGLVLSLMFVPFMLWAVGVL